MKKANNITRRDRAKKMGTPDRRSTLDGVAVKKWYQVGGWLWGVIHTTDACPPHGNVYRALLARAKRGACVCVYTRGDGKEMGGGYCNVHVGGVLERNEQESLHEWVRMAALGDADCPPPPLLETTERVAKALGAESEAGR